MTIVGVSLKPVLTDSHIFIKCEGKLGLDLAKLYELAYNETIPRKLSGPEWSGVRYFHGTGHCAYVDRYANRALGHKITTSSWCSTRTCAVREILRHGYLMRFCLRGTAIFTDVSSRVDMMSYNPHAIHLEGHFISSSGQIASGYAQARMVKAALQYRAIFVCKVRHRHLNISGRRYVHRNRVCACELHGMPFKNNVTNRPFVARYIEHPSDVPGRCLGVGPFLSHRSGFMCIPARSPSSLRRHL